MRTRIVPLVLTTLATLFVAPLAAPPAAAGEPAVLGARPDHSQAVQSRAVAPTRPAVRPAALPPDYPFWNLQLNLCNSGIAGCFEDGRSVPEAAGVIAEWFPDVVTLNEVCASDVDGPLLDAMAAAWPGDWVFYVFMPAWNVAANGPYQCTAGRGAYGNAVIGHVLAEDWAGMVPDGGIFQWQDAATNEWRSWACANAVGNYYACATHLAAGNGAAAMLQCEDLLSSIVPAQWAAGGYRPTVVGGDFNLHYNGSPNIQDCVPGGWYRKGDGDVQHWFVTNDLAFDFTREIGLSHTDHPGWLVATIA